MQIFKLQTNFTLGLVEHFNWLLSIFCHLFS